MGHIYLITNSVNGKGYIGKTERSIAYNVKTGGEGRPSKSQNMWLCWHMACEVRENSPFLPQHKTRRVGMAIGAYALVGERLNLSPDTVEYHVRNARKRRETEEGLGEYIQWLNNREARWWFHHAEVNKKELKLREYVGKTQGDTLILTRGDLPFTRKQVETIMREAQNLLIDARGTQDYEEWVARYESRPPSAQRSPLVYRPLPPNHPASIAMDERRAAAGLRNGLTKRGRPRR
jgi:hypothetical protein